MAARVSGRAARQFILGQRMGRAPLGMFCGGRPDKRRAARTESAAKKTQHKHDAFGPTLSDAPVAAQLIEEEREERDGGEGGGIARHRQAVVRACRTPVNLYMAISSQMV